MTLFAVIFAVLILSLFWGGFAFMLSYTLKQKEKAKETPERE
jgi:hypothetical protein